MKKKLFESSKRKFALFLAMTLTATAAGNIYVNKKDGKIYAAEVETYYFAEGYGTGNNFSTDSWTISTNFDSNVADVYKGADYQAAIVANNYSDAKEPVIRLINGVDPDNLNNDAGNIKYDYRAGTAISADKITLKEQGQFSAKFTISMPDACTDTIQAGGETYAREVGGDGIAFIITTQDEINGQAGSGIGYEGISDSIIVELDSYFNGAYCMTSAADNGYPNWGFDNQIYSSGESTGYAYLSGIDQLTTDAQVYSSGYAQLPGSATRRFDHVGVIVDGDPRTHLEISYLNNLKPNEIADGKYTNISNPSASTVSDRADCATRFADEGVNDRLFTVWVEYDGTNMYISYANGNFLTAVRPATPQITIEGNTAIANKFANEQVNIGFTSAIGTSKANHTVHSVEFVNEYLENGITSTQYTQKYYVETPTAEADYISVNNKKYVLKESVLKTEVELGSSAKIEDKSTEDGYKSYNLVDSSNPAYSAYPAETDSVRADGGTVLYQFYDKAPAYQVRYFKKDRSTNQYVQVTDDTSEVKTGQLGTVVSITDIDTGYEGKYAADNYAFSTSATQVTSVTLSDAETTYYLDLYYDPMVTNYKLNYHKWDSATNSYVLAESSEEKEGFVGSQYTVTDVDPAYETKYVNYTVNTQKNDTFSVTLSQVADTPYEMDVYYDPVQAGYKLNYYKLNPNTGVYEFAESTTVKQGNVGQTYKVEDADASYTTKYTSEGYEVNSSKNEDYSVTLVDSTGTYDLKVYYDPVKVSYTTEYWLEQPDGTYIKETGDTVVTPDVYAGTDITAVIKTYEEYEHTTTTDSNEKDTVKADGSTVLKVYYDLKPQYTVRYYKETSSDMAGAIEVGGKYYVLQKDDSVTMRAATGTMVVVSSKEDGTVGVKEDTTEVTQTFKSYEGFAFSDTATTANGKTSGTLSKAEDLVIEVFYDIIKTEYKEQYWVEDPNATTDYVEIEINGEIKKFVLSETNDVVDTDAGTSVTVTDKSAEYTNYELVKVEIPGYPSSVDGIKPDGTTTVHQIYVLKPTYQVQYYVEVPEKTDDSIEVNGKYYTLKPEETITKYASTGTAVKVISNTNGAGVVEGETEISGTFKLFDGYIYNQTATDENGKTGGEVSSDNDIVIMLLYDLEEQPEEPTTETPEETTTKAPEEPTTKAPEEPTTKAPEEPTTKAPEEPATKAPEEPTTKSGSPVITGDRVSMAVFILLICSGCTAVMIIIGKKKADKE